jgi:voltage-dependent calcium channel L type alpha-1D
LIEQGLGKFVDADFIRTTSREMQEAMDMTQEEMDLETDNIVED